MLLQGHMLRPTHWKAMLLQGHMLRPTHWNAVFLIYDGISAFSKQKTILVC